MKILVTGAFGNIGEYTVKALLEQGHAVVCFDQRNPRNTKAAKRLGTRCQVIWGDILDFKALPKVLAGVDTVIHLAAVIPPLSETNEALAFAVNVKGTENLINAMQDSSLCKRLIFASTTAVHGSDVNRTPPVKLTSPLNPPDAYAKHKVSCEENIRNSTLNWSILRVAATPPLDLRKAQKNSANVLFEVPVNTRVEVMHAADAGLAFANAAGCPASIGKTLFLGGGKANGCQIYGYDLICAMADGAGFGHLPKKAFTTDPNSVHADWVDTEESQALLQFQRHCLQDMIAETQKQAGIIYYITRLFAPAIRHYLLRQSPYYAAALKNK